MARGGSPPPSGASAIIPNMLHCSCDILNIVIFEALWLLNGER